MALRRFRKEEGLGDAMADDESINPFVARMRQLDSEAMGEIERGHEQSVKELRDLNAQRVKEIIDQNTQRLALIKTTHDILLNDALEAAGRILPKEIRDVGEISFTSEAFAWYGEVGFSEFNIPGDLLVCTESRSYSYRTKLNTRVGSSDTTILPDGSKKFKRSFFAPNGNKIYESQEGFSTFPDSGKKRAGMVFSKNFYPLAYITEGHVEIVERDSEGEKTAPQILDGTKGMGVRNLEISPNGKTVYTLQEGNKRLLWSLRTKKSYKEIVAPSYRHKYSPDGEFIVGYTDREIIIIHPLDGTHTEHRFRFEWGDTISSIAFHPSRQIIAVGCTKQARPNRGEVFLWDIKTKENIRAFGSLEGPVHHLDFSPDGTILAVNNGKSHSRILLLDVESGKQEGLNSCPREPILSLQFDPSGINRLEGFDVMMAEIHKKIEESGLKLHTKNHIDFKLTWERRVQL